MDDFLYILLFIGWIAYSFYSAVQKKKKKEMKARPAYERQPTSVEPEKPEGSVFEDLFGEQFEEFQEPAEIQEEPIFEVIPRETKFQFYQEPEYEELGTANDSVLISQLTDSSASEIPELITEEKASRHRDFFDLRKAVIYTAVLERPYK